MRAQLEGAQFRQLNETLYTQSGDASFALLSHQPHLFHAYHKGYRNQVADWPQNPLDIMIAEVKYVFLLTPHSARPAVRLRYATSAHTHARTHRPPALTRAGKRRLLW